VKSASIRRWAIFIVLSVASIAVYRACRETRESFYPTLADAVKAGEVTHGWLPDYLPGSSRNIYLLYDITSSETWCAFEFSPDDSEGLQEKMWDDLRPIKSIGNPGVSWWPDFLKGDVDVGKVGERGFVLQTTLEPAYGSRMHAVVFVFDSNKGRGFFYKPSGDGMKNRDRLL
jgi:hypothetical protein